MTGDGRCDVLIVGTGAAALTAALVTSAAGLDTIIVEKTAWLGGTSAISGAALWVPANHVARAKGIEDSPEDALAYIRALAPPGWWETEDHLWQRFVAAAPRMLAFIEARSPLRFQLTPQPDPFPKVRGAKSRGRMVSPGPLNRRIVGRYAQNLRPPMLPHIFTYQEFLQHDPYHHPMAATFRLMPRVLWRMIGSARGMGTALITGLLKGCLDHGCRVQIGGRAIELVVNEHGDVIGAEVEQRGVRQAIRTRRGVILATGGFEWNRELVAEHFPGPIDFITSPRGNEGDGHLMARRVGAEMAHMDQANFGPALPIVYEDRLQGMSIAFHQEPNAIIVDRHGRRFVDEFRFNIGEVLSERDPSTGAPLHLPAWLITDRRFLKRSPMARWFSGYDRNWMVKGASLEELARRTGIPEDLLLLTVERFNAFCADGFDPDFRRGEARPGVRGDARDDLVPIRHPPFLAMRLNASFISTKGGPRTNEHGEVLRSDGQVIKGLLCAGVAMANPIGTWAVGTGTTLGPNMAWGYICGQTLSGGESAVRGLEGAKT
jgi:3-oxosteroid 1-dehydrogenase